MPNAANVPLRVQRNEDLTTEVIQLVASGQIIDITGWTFVMKIATAPGLSPSLSLNATPSGNGSYITIDDAPNGAIRRYINKADIAALSGSTTASVVFAYNIIATANTGETFDIVVGTLTLDPGI